MHLVTYMYVSRKIIYPHSVISVQRTHGNQFNLFLYLLIFDTIMPVGSPVRCPGRIAHHVILCVV